MPNAHDVLFKTLADPTRRAIFRALAPLLDWTRRLAGFWESRLDNLEDLLRRMDQ